MGAFRRALLDSGARLGPAMPPNYFRFFCDKLLRSFAPRLLDAVFRCRKVSDVGCQQVRGGCGGVLWDVLWGGLLPAGRRVRWGGVGCAGAGRQHAGVDAMTVVQPDPHAHMHARTLSHTTILPPPPRHRCGWMWR